MKRILFLLLILSNYAYASFPEDLFGLKLGMDRHAAEMVMSKNNLELCKDVVNSEDISCYKGRNIEIQGIVFDEVSIMYDDKNVIKGLVFKLFIPQSEGTQRRIFRYLYDEIVPYAKSTKDENIRYNYLFRLNDKGINNYIRLSIKDVVQRNVGYNIILTSSYSDKRIN